MVEYGEIGKGSEIQLSSQSPKMISGSDLNKLSLGDVNFQYDITLHVSATLAHNFAKVATARFKEENVKILPIRHTTFNDGSESDLWVHYASEGEEHVLVEIHHRWIDLYFLAFWLWEPDREKKGDYSIDYLFPSSLIAEHTKYGERGGEIFIAPCTIRIRTSKEDPKGFLPPEDALQKLVKETSESPWIKFWRCFKENNYKQAAACIREVQKLSRERDSAYFFLDAIEALCCQYATQYEKAVKLFIQAAAGFDITGFDRNCDACLFFAIEAAKKINDLNQSTSLLNQIAQEIPDLSPSQREEVSDILRAYAVRVYIGVVVLCRRVLEITITQILTGTYGVAIDTLVKECRKTGVLPSRAGGLYAVLEAARWKGILTTQEFDIASGIKDFGNRIHDKDRLEDAIDAKYAIQACIHLLRRLRRFGSFI
jgi:tetratricopeptide (TPR) repeat protein